MARLAEVTRPLIEKLVSVFRRKSPEQRRLKALVEMEEKLWSAQRANTDAVEALKAEIRTLEARALQKKKEHERTHGDSRRIVVGEIERIFRELDRLRGRERIVASNLDRIGLALAKIGEAKAAIEHGITEEEFDDIALEIQDLFGQLRDADRAARELEREQYKIPEPAPVDVEKRMAELEEESQPEMEAPADLPPELEKRLRRLEAEGE